MFEKHFRMKTSDKKRFIVNGVNPGVSVDLPEIKKKKKNIYRYILGRENI